MVKYIIKRLLLAVLILLGVSIIIYASIRLMPVNVIINKFTDQALSGAIEPEELNRILALYGLNDDSFKGILKGYFSWLWNFVQGDMGISFMNNRPVGQVIAENMGKSFTISLVSLVLELLIAIPLGVKCACNQYGKLDYTATVLCMIGMAFPTFFLGNIFIKLILDTRAWNIPEWMRLPIVGWESTELMNPGFFEHIFDVAKHLVIPMTVLVILNIGAYMRYMRTNTLEVLNADYIRTARAKGLGEGTVVYKHVFRNTLIPLVTVLSSTLPMLFGGAMITEEVFGIPGIGKVAYDALKVGDIPLAMGYNMFIAVLTVIGVLLADIMYAVVDPRVKLTA